MMSNPWQFWNSANTENSNGEDRNSTVKTAGQKTEAK
jgi:hypothetical protein